MRSARLVDLIGFLACRTGRSIDDIRERYLISTRTAFRDLLEIERVAPLVRDDGRYRVHESATLRGLALSNAEQAMLAIALTNPALRHQPALAPILASLDTKLAAARALREEDDDALRQPAASPVQLAGPDRSGPNAGRHLEPLRALVAERRPAEILYTSLSGQEQSWRGVDPWAVVHRIDAWYLVARCHRHDAPRIFRLDRIADLRPLAGAPPFAIPADFDLDRYLAGAWQLQQGDGHHHVVVHAHRSLAPLLRHAQHHPSERVRELADGTLELTVTLSSIEEIARWILAYGGRLRPLAPPALVLRVRELATGTLDALAPPTPSHLAEEMLLERGPHTPRKTVRRLPRS